MARLPFDPGKVVGAEREVRAEAASGGQLTVSELAELIRSVLETHVAAPVTVVGQVSNLSTPNHWYFTLKDEQAVVSCVAWASSARKFGFVPSDGDAVLATGHVSHYAPQGRTQFYVRSLQPVGAGALQIKFQQMCEELRGLGYFSDERKKPVPTFPRRIAVITSAEGAAIHDVISTAQQRCRAVGLLIVDVRVQGDGAATEVARAIRWVDRKREELGVDAILVTRGGGSIEDLWAFNERAVADAVYECTLPVVAAIGHESDTTVIELVADLRAATPTQAAMRLVPDGAALSQQLDHVSRRLTLLTQRRVDAARSRLETLRRHEIIRDPNALIRRPRERLERFAVDLGRLARTRVAQERGRLEVLAARLARLHGGRLVSARYERLAVLADRLSRAMAHRMNERPRVDAIAARLRGVTRQRLSISSVRLESLRRQLMAVDPRRVLERGFSYTTDERGGVLRSVGEVQVGATIRTHLSDGAIRSVAAEIESEPDDAAPAAPPNAPLAPPPPPPPPPARPSAPRRGSDPPDDRPQMDLFTGER